VLATGLAPDANLYEECFRRHVAPEVYNIGDSFAVGRVFEAVRAGFTLGRTL
jgi:2-enoate reductase